MSVTDNNPHDVFGFPARITTALDLATIEGATDSLHRGTPWTDYVLWRKTLLVDHAAGLHFCGEENCVWCPLGEDCDEHPLAAQRKLQQ